MKSKTSLESAGRCTTNFRLKLGPDDSHAGSKPHVACDRLRHRHFFREAGRQATPAAVQQSVRFVNTLPPEFTSLQTFTMLVSVCISARDVTTAMQVAAMLRSSGRKPDTILYTNLITGTPHFPMALVPLCLQIEVSAP